jgi:hypothetical protein
MCACVVVLPLKPAVRPPQDAALGTAIRRLFHRLSTGFPLKFEQKLPLILRGNCRSPIYSTLDALQ